MIREAEPQHDDCGHSVCLPGVVEDVCVMETWNPEKAASWNQAPKLHFRLDYDQKKAELFVTSLEGTALCDWQGLVYALPVGWEDLQLERARDSTRTNGSSCAMLGHGASSVFLL